MADMPERIWAFEDDLRISTSWRTSYSVGRTEYVRADLVAAKDERIQFLEAALREAIYDCTILESDLPHLSKFLQEEQENGM